MIETWFNQDTKRAVKVQAIDGNVFSMDNGGNKIGVNLTSDGAPYTITGTISANVIRQDGGTVVVQGSKSGNQAWVILPESCVVYPGFISIIIKETIGTSVTTVCAVVANVYQSTTDSYVDPGTIIPSIETLIYDIEAAVASIPADYSSLWTSLAPAFSTSTSYSIGQYVTYNGGLYRFIANHTAGSWSSSDVTTIKLGNDISELSNTLGDISYGKDNIDGKLRGLQTGTAATIHVRGLTISDKNGYMNADGTVSWANSHRLMVAYDRTIRRITFPAFTTSVSIPTVVVKNYDDVVASYTWDTTNDYTIELPGLPFTAIYINWWNGNKNDPYFSLITFFYDLKISYAENVQNAMGSPSFPGNELYGQTLTVKFDECANLLDGYIDINNSSGMGASHKHVLIPARMVKKISISSNSSSAVAWAILYGIRGISNRVLIDGGIGGSYEFDAPTQGFIGINNFRDINNTFAKAFTVEFWSEKELENFSTYNNSVRKPFSFEGKTAVFTGDSITVGFTSGSSTTQNNYPKLFSEKVGLSYQNIAVGGACFTPGMSEATTIPAQVATINSAPDFLFIAGGINDWQTGALLNTFKTTIESLCDYCTEHFPNTEVIWILPIKHAGWEKTHPALQAYSYPKAYGDIIYEVVKSKDQGRFSVINGALFGFPGSDSHTEYVSAMFGDLLHPSEIGYRNLYVPGLLTTLL